MNPDATLVRSFLSYRQEQPAYFSRCIALFPNRYFPEKEGPFFLGRALEARNSMSLQKSGPFFPPCRAGD